MGTRRIKAKQKFAVDIETRSPKGHHFDRIVADDLYPPLGGPATFSNATVSNWPPRNQLTFAALQQALRKLQQITFDPVLESTKLTKEEMAKQVELYKNVIETKFGVKLCVKSNINSDMITMELLVPTKLFADDGGRESLADALQNIAMFILNMENPSDL